MTRQISRMPEPPPPLVSEPKHDQSNGKYRGGFGSLWLQVLATILLQFVVTHIFIFITSPDPLNLLWLGGPGVVIGLLANRGVARVGMAAALLIVSSLTVSGYAAFWGLSY